MNIIKKVFDFKGAPLLAVMFLALFVMEGRRQLRKRKQSKWSRVVTNSIVAIPAFSLLRFLFLPVIIKLALKNQGWQIGANRFISNYFARAAFAFLLMDYTNYLWHVLNHKLPLLWRFHVVHHTDHDLDVTTAVRFHFCEIIGSVFYRGAFVIASGATPLTVLIYEIVFEGATQFHHSNWKLPFKLEKALNKVIVTPRMHGIHHSIVREETDSNYSVIFSFWDRLHKTMLLNIHQDKIITGVPSYDDPKELTIKHLLKMPFLKQKKWPEQMINEDGRQAHPDKNKLAE